MLPGDLLIAEANLEQVLDTIATLTLTIHQIPDLSELLQTTISTVQQRLGCERVLIYRFLPGGDGVVAEEVVNSPWKPILGQLIYDPCFEKSWYKKYQQTWVGILEDIENLPSQSCYKKLLTRLQVRANLVAPILVKSSSLHCVSSSFTELWGLLIAHQCDKPHQWQKSEIKFMEQIALQLGIAIQNFKSSSHCQGESFYSPTQAQDQALTLAELKAFDRLKNPLWIFDIHNLKMTWANQAALSIWSASSREELLNRNFSDISESSRIRLQNYLQHFEQGESLTEYWTFYPNGQPISVRCVCSGITIEAGRTVMLVEGYVEVVSEMQDEFLRSLEALRHSTEIISQYTLEGIPLMQNPATLACYGNLHSATSSAKNVFLSRFLDPAIGQQALTHIKLDEVVSLEAQVVTQKGIRWHSLDIHCTRDPITGNKAILVMEKDITERYIALENRQQVEEELRWKEALLRSMTDTSQLAFFVVDNRTDHILYFNHKFCTIWGIEHLEEQMQAGVLKNNDIIPSCINLIADLPGFIETCKPLQSEENRVIIEDEIKFVDGRVIRRFSGQIRDAQDRYFGRLYIFEDISDRIANQIALQESEERYRSVIAAMAEGVVLQQADGKITACNDSATRILGLTLDQMMGKTSIDPQWKAIHEDGSIFPGENHPAMVTLRTHQPLFDVIMGIRKPDQQLTWISINSQPLFAPSETQPYAVVTSFTDITIRKQAEQALQQQAERERMLYAIAQRIRQSLDLDQTLNTTVAEVRQFLQTDRVVIYRFNPDWSGRIVSESVNPEWKSILNWEIDDTFFAENQGQTYQQNTIKITPDIYQVNLTDCHLELLERLQVRAKLVVPILQGNVLWGLLIAHHCSSPRDWHLSESEFLQQLATQVAIAIQQSEFHSQLQLANQQLENLALLDSLTQVANRRSFDRTLSQNWQHLIQEKRPLTLLICDIDYFKQYNDTYGHAMGDTCLHLVAQALAREVQKQPSAPDSFNLIARYGGEEFAIILPKLNLKTAVKLAQNIQKTIRQLQIPHQSSQVASYVTLSMGIATCIPNSNQTPLDLIQIADRNLYHAKANGRNRWSNRY